MLRFPAVPNSPADLPSWLKTFAPGVAQELDRIDRTEADIVVARRLAPYAGKELVAADFALSAAWGAGATVAVALGSTDARGRITITAAGVPAAGPTITLTFRDGAWRQAPFGLVLANGGTGALLAATWVTTTQTLVITLPGATPVAGLTYTYEFILLG